MYLKLKAITQMTFPYTITNNIKFYKQKFIAEQNKIHHTKIFPTGNIPISSMQQQEEIFSY